MEFRKRRTAQKLMADQPTGTVTLLFTDIEGSTKLWEKSPRGMQVALTRHDALLWEAIEGHGGFVFKTVGDAFCAVFPTALDALESALAAQRGLFAEAWGEEIGVLK
ncbi:MAG TPA: adenylate/guanylate cyclase domain-containing protein, partial [Rubrobacter sp.]|nr:adenylate/guanylate cyclase domain-containing protein [Rubrobacter sp.]